VGQRRKREESQDGRQFAQNPDGAENRNSRCSSKPAGKRLRSVADSQKSHKGSAIRMKKQPDGERCQEESDHTARKQAKSPRVMRIVDLTGE
jgi:hypothetical protein